MKKILITQPVTIVANGNFPKHHIPLEILNKSKLKILSATNLDDAAKKIVKSIE